MGPSCAFAVAWACLVGCACATPDRLSSPPAASERATGGSGTRVEIEASSAVGWSGGHPLWSVTLRVPESVEPEHRFLLVTDRTDAGELVPIAALDLGPGGRVRPIPWPLAAGGVMLASEATNALWHAPWLAPLTLPAGAATFDPSGSRVVVARGEGLEVFDTVKRTRLFAWPHVKGTGVGAFVAPTLYAESTPSSARALVVDVANGALLLDEAEASASAVSPSGKVAAVLRVVEKPNAFPRLSLALVDLEAPANPRTEIDLGAGPQMSGTLSLAFDGDRGVGVLLSETSALMHQGSTYLLSYVALGSNRAGPAPKDYRAPDRSTAFAELAKLVAPSLHAPRVAIPHWLHSQTFAEDRATARAVLVTGLPIASGRPSHVGQPSLAFVDTAAHKLVRDVPLPVAELTIDNVSLAPGGRSAIVCATEGPSFLVDADTAVVLSGAFDCASTRGGLWSADGEHLITDSGLVTLHARGKRALLETPLRLGAACLTGTVLTRAEVCR